MALRTGHPPPKISDIVSRSGPRGKIYDLLIIGAGPAGSNAAAVALQGGLTVAQVDAAVFPRVKPCAGGITPRCLASLQHDLVKPVSSCSVWVNVDSN